MRFKLLFPLITLLASLALAKSPKSLDYSDGLIPDQKWLRAELVKNGLPKSFVELAIKTYDKKSFPSVIRLNVLGFLKTPNHQSLVTPEALRHGQSFITKNRKALEAAKKRYAVPPEVISSLLWIETRHGALKGSFHVLSVYLHLLQGEREKIRSTLALTVLNDPGYDGHLTEAELRQKIRERTSIKAEWALEQIRALEKIHRRKMLSVATLRGSFAGAFGIPQFIPSSYLNFSRSSVAKRPANLFDVRDSIESVARYLSLHGWKTKDPAARINSLMEYNKSRDYAESILEMSRLLRERGALDSRFTASDDEGPH